MHYTTFKAHSRKEENDSINRLEDCMVKVKHWMYTNRLKMNSTKTEFTMFGRKAHLQKCVTKNLDVPGDENLSLKSHISKKCPK